MAKSKASAKQNAKKASAAAPAASGAAGGRAAFFAACLAVLGLVCYFLPWYADSKEVVLSGVDLLRMYDDAPFRLRDGFGLVGGRAFLVGLPILYVIVAAAGFAPAAVAQLAQRFVAELHVALFVGATSAGLFVMLIMLNMQVVDHVALAGHVNYVILLLLALCELLVLMAIDRESGRADEAALTGADWGTWLGGLVIATFVNYVWVCYALVPRAEDAVREIIRRRR